MPTTLEQAILTTLAYFAHFHFPLTTFEVWKWLMADEPAAFLDVDRALRTSPWLVKYIVRHGAYWGIGDVEAQVEERRTRYTDAVVKSRKASGYAWLLRHMPGIEGVAICNSLAFHHTTQTSDIDFFIITAPRHTWTARLFATLPAILLRQRPLECDEHPVCLSFFASTDALDMVKLKIEDDDPYFAYWLVTLSPLLDRDDVFTKLWHANSWIRQRLPNAYPVRRSGAFRFFVRKGARRFGLLEAWAERVQRGRFPRSIRELMNKDTRVVVSNSVLKFHDNDRRLAIKTALDDRMKTYGIDRRVSTKD